MTDVLDPHTMPLHGLRLIEAGAGTGKTYSLTGLYLRALIEDEPLPVERIAVVTYTVSAANELKVRIVRRLNSALAWLDEAPCEDEFVADYLTGRFGQPAAAETLRPILLSALRSMDQAPIETIHQFCLRALSEHGIAVGKLSEDQRVADDWPLLVQVAEDHWTAALAARRADEAQVITNWITSPTELMRCVLALWTNPQARRCISCDDAGRALADAESAAAALAEVWSSAEELVAELKDAAACYKLSRAKKSYAPERTQAWVDKIGEWAAGGHAVAASPASALAEFTTERMLAARLQSCIDEPPPRNMLIRSIEVFLQAHARWCAALQASFVETAADAIRRTATQIKRRQNMNGFQDLIDQLASALTGPAGEVLAPRLARQWPLIMVDEFQDTDPLQYRIFKSILAAGTRRSGLVAIGDPKQAIYGFRGGDVYTYLQAALDVDRSDAAGRYILTRNWRSAPRLIDGINAVFSRPDPFLMGQLVSAPPAIAERSEGELKRDGRDLSGLAVVSPAVEKKLNKADAQELCAQRAACEITRLLDGRTTLGGRSLQPSDIAILVRSNEELRRMQVALRKVGIGASTRVDTRVFASAEAQDLRQVIEALLMPHQLGRVRAAFGSHLLGEGVAALADAELREEQWLRTLQAWREEWREHGAYRWLYRLICSRSAAILALDNGQRRLTNYLHLLDLMRMALPQPNPRAVLLWLSDKIESPERETEAELRLESDRKLVQLLTLHRAKGLEYPVVLLPFAWGIGPYGLRAPICAHDPDDDFRLHIALDASAGEALATRACTEAMGEELRLLYVAMTRARERCYLFASEQFAYRRTPAALDWLLDATRRDGLTKQAADVESALERWRASGAEIQAVELPDTPVTAAGATQERPLRLGRSAAAIPRAQATYSFTGLVRGHGGAAQDYLDASALAADDLRVPARGARFGIFYHRLLERWADDPAAIGAEALRYQRDAAGFTEKNVPLDALREMLLATLHAPLAPTSSTLAQSTPDARVAELEFDLAVTAHPTRPLLNVWSSLRGGSVQLTNSGLAGYLRGYVDLVVRVADRYFIIDYKTNVLPGYDEQALRGAVHQHDYDLQYLLYTLALHRLLRHRLPDYDPDRHLGGCWYLFVRGMRPDRPGEGVHFARMRSDWVRELDAAWQ